MSQLRIVPGPVAGKIRAPPSKSYTHRALVAAHLTGHRYVIERPLRSDDTLRTVAAVRALGSRVKFSRDRWTVSPARPPARARSRRIDCGESGTTLRFASALASLSSAPVQLVGRGRLPDRPMGPLAAALRALGASVSFDRPRHSLPMTLRGPLRGGEVVVDASESSQFVSALLLALPTLAEDSRIRLPTPPVSKPYIDATLAVLRASGVRVEAARQVYRIPGAQQYSGRRFRVPGDASSAAYLWSAAAVAGGAVTVEGLPDDWPQADLKILDLLERFGARVDRSTDGTTVRSGERRPFTVELTAAPDLYPLAGVLAACAPGRSCLRGARQVVVKESDRRRETMRLARRLGATVRSSADGLEIRSDGRPRPIELSGATDHRIVMSAAIGALAASGPSTVGDAGSVAKSFPDFWKVLAQLTREGRKR